MTDAFILDAVRTPRGITAVAQLKARINAARAGMVYRNTKMGVMILEIAHGTIRQQSRSNPASIKPVRSLRSGF